jgi:tRNA threonylcarbamoyladenosine biosynthesis protein TsaE
MPTFDMSAPEFSFVLPESDLELVLEEIMALIDDAEEEGDPVRVISLEGDLGAGKTTLVKALCAALGYEENVSSPTFGLVNEYSLPDGRLLCHSDWYRVNEASELWDAGIEEGLHQEDCLWLVEWPEIGNSLLEPLNRLAIRIEHQGDERRYEARWM